jgi:hypothetical protein
MINISYLVFALAIVIAATSLWVLNNIGKQVPCMPDHLHWAPRLVGSKEPPSLPSRPTPHHSCCCGNGSGNLSWIKTAAIFPN